MWWGQSGCWWSELESLSGFDISNADSRPEGPREGVLTVQLRTHRAGVPVDKKVGLTVSSRWGLLILCLILCDSLLEPEFQGSWGLKST